MPLTLNTAPPVLSVAPVTLSAPGRAVDLELRISAPTHGSGGTLPISFFSVGYEASVQTTYWGSRPELVEVLNLAARGLVRPTVATVPLERAMDAYRGMEAGRVTGRVVIDPTLPA